VFRRINGQLVNTVSFGSGDRAVVGVGGWVGTWELWQQPLELLSTTWRTVAYDHFGVGQTVAPPELLTFEAQVDAVFEVMDAHGLARCLLAGESAGGAVAAAAALRQPERFSGVIFVSTGFARSDDEITRRFVEMIRSDFAAVVPAFVQMCVPEPDCVHVRRWLEHIISSADPDVAARLIEALYEVDLRPQLSNLAVPALIVHGALDALPASSPDGARAAAELIPDCELAMLDDAGHVPTLTRPEAVAAAIAARFDAAA
jgi:pimeloyl-ACP methyl ester carboxylesterase